MQKISYHNISFQNNLIPFSISYNDTFFSTAGIAKESQQVFVSSSNLQQRFSLLSKLHKCFTIAELGLGFGVNFLFSVDAFLKYSPPYASLNYIVCELAPPQPHVLQEFYSKHPYIPLSQFLLPIYPHAIPGFHFRRLLKRVRLTVYLGEGTQFLQLLANNYHTHYMPKVDAWFLDGFAPQRNPNMWSADIFRNLSSLSTNHTTVTTYSVSTSVVRKLAAQGFTVRKVDGVGHKKHSLHAKLQHTKNLHPRPTPDDHITIIGNGIMGLCLAYDLSNLGYHVRVLGNRRSSPFPPFPMIAPGKINPYSLKGKFLLQSFLDAIAFYDKLHDTYKSIWQQRSVFELDNTLKTNNTKIFNHDFLPHNIHSDWFRPLTKTEAEKYCNISHRGILHTKGGILNGSVLYNSLKQHVTEMLYVHAYEIKKLSSTTNPRWQVFDSNGKLLSETQNLIVAAGRDSLNLIPQLRTKLKVTGGDINLVSQQYLNIQPSLPLIYGGALYKDPTLPYYHIVSSHYPVSQSLNLSLNPNSFLQSYHYLQKTIPHAFINNFNPKNISPSGWSGSRAFTSDYFPICGSVYAQRGLWVTTALGSKGFQFAPFLSTMLSSLLSHSNFHSYPQLLKYMLPANDSY